MTTATVCVPHCDTPWFLKACLESIAAHQHHDLDIDVIVACQTQDHAMHKQVYGIIAASPLKVKLLHCRLLGCGHGIDEALRFATGEYFCTLDCDAWPIHKNWLWVPVRLIADGHAQWVGSDTGLALSYKEKGHFVHLNNYYRVSRTDVARTVSRNVGFIRWDSRWEVDFHAKDYYWESLGGTVKCDNGVVAMHHTRDHKKISLPILRCLGRAPSGIYGMVIEDLVFHLVFARNRLQNEDPAKAYGKDYLELYDAMQKHGVSRDDITLLVKTANDGIWVGDFRKLDGNSVSDDLNKRIEETKQS